MTPPQDVRAQLQRDLPSDLHDYLAVDKYGVIFHHPFFLVRVLDAFRLETSGETLARYILESQDQFTQRCEAADWVGALMIVERPYRAEYFADLIQEHGIERLITALNYVWGDAGYVSNDEEALGLWQHIWCRVRWTRSGKPRKRRYHVVHEEDSKTFQALPRILTVYRGYGVAGDELGYSWTLNRAKAEWFARRNKALAGGPFIASMEVSKDLILAYFNGREEEEVVIEPESIFFDDIRIESLPSSMTDAA